MFSWNKLECATVFDKSHSILTSRNWFDCLLFCSLSLLNIALYGCQYNFENFFALWYYCWLYTLSTALILTYAVCPLTLASLSFGRCSICFCLALSVKSSLMKLFVPVRFCFLSLEFFLYPCPLSNFIRIDRSLLLLTFSFAMSILNYSWSGIKFCQSAVVWVLWLAMIHSFLQRLSRHFFSAPWQRKKKCQHPIEEESLC